MTNLTASEPSLLDSKLDSTGWAAWIWPRVMSITAAAFSSLQQTPRRRIERAVDDRKIYNEMRYEVMRHEARRLI